MSHYYIVHGGWGGGGVRHHMAKGCTLQFTRYRGTQWEGKLFILLFIRYIRSFRTHTPPPDCRGRHAPCRGSQSCRFRSPPSCGSGVCQATMRFKGKLFVIKRYLWIFFFFYMRYSTPFHLPPLRFHCVRGCWDRTQDSCDYGIDCQTL